MENIFSFILPNYLTSIPVFIVWIAGLIIAVVRWGKHPRASLFATLGLLLLILRWLVSPWVSLLIHESEVPLTQIGVRFSIFNIVSALLAAAAWVLILIALFGRRLHNETSTKEAGKV